jgi:PIN domain nuclease of toxin-antitoxin system
MEQNRITLDTHSMAWYIHEPSKKRLSKKALETIRFAERTGIVYIPAIALLELLRLVEKGKIPIPFVEVLGDLERSGTHEIVPLDIELIRIAMEIQELELHDRLIVATAIMTDSVLISKDREIMEASGVSVVW